MKEQNTSYGFLVALFVILILGVYVGTYFALTQHGGWMVSFKTSKDERPRFIFTTSSNQSVRVVLASECRGAPAALFAPIHYLDRRFFRPKLWTKMLTWKIVGQPSLVGTRIQVRKAPGIPNGVEAAERINAEQMRQYRLERERAIQNPHELR